MTQKGGLILTLDQYYGKRLLASQLIKQCVDDVIKPENPLIRNH